VASIHEILREKKVRTGAFTPGLYNPYAFMAECKEGGHVIIMRKGEQWERMSATFPVPLNPPMRLVPGDKDQVLRDGCRGADYAQ
jgi:hypothetical protein